MYQDGKEAESVMNKIYGLRFDPKEPSATARLCDAAGLKYIDKVCLKDYNLHKSYSYGGLAR